MKRRQFLYGAAAAVAVGATGYIVARRVNPDDDTPPVDPDADGGEGKSAIDANDATQAVWKEGDVPQGLWALNLPDPEDVTHAMSQFRGHRVVVNFWATWCAPCVKEMPDLDALARKHGSVRFVGIGIDSAANIRAFVEKVPVDYTLLVMTPGGIDLMRRMGNSQGGLPFTVVLDRNGALSHRILGQIDPDELDRILSS